MIISEHNIIRKGYQLDPGVCRNDGAQWDGLA